MSETLESPKFDLDDNNPPKPESPTSPLPKAHTTHNNKGAISESAPPPSKLDHFNSRDLVRDIALWRRKQVNVSILAAATATWVLMDVYQYNFITLLSWLTIALLSCFFFWGTAQRFFQREVRELSEFEISEVIAMEQARILRQWAEDGIRWIVHVGVESEWFVSLGVVASLYLMSLVANRFDFLALCFIGIVGAMTVPMIYVKNEERIGEFAENVRVRSQRLKVMIEEKMQKMKNKIAGKGKGKVVVKEKKSK